VQVAGSAVRLPGLLQVNARGAASHCGAGGIGPARRLPWRGSGAMLGDFARSINALRVALWRSLYPQSSSNTVCRG